VKRWYPSTAVALVLMSALVLALGACGGGDDDDESGRADDRDTTTTRAEETTTTTAALTPEEAVLRDYQAAAQAAVAASNPPDPNHADLLRYWGGDALARIQSTLAQWQGLNLGSQQTTETHPEVTSVAGDSATLHDCFVNTSQFVDLATGQPSGEPETVTLNVDVTLERHGDVWVAVLQETRSEPCTPA
jgi:hypothetical protein